LMCFMQVVWLLQRLPILLFSLHGCKQAECNNSYPLYFYGLPTLIPLLFLPKQSSFLQFIPFFDRLSRIYLYFRSLLRILWRTEEGNFKFANIKLVFKSRGNIFSHTIYVSFILHVTIHTGYKNKSLKIKQIIFLN
jgi:hypothetical protein